MSFFSASNPLSQDQRKRTQRKNHNWPILARLYFGSRTENMRCKINNTPAWITCLHLTGPLVGTPHDFLCLEFNHIRQFHTGSGAGRSVDSTGSPSGFYRDFILDKGDEKSRRLLLEFMCIIPVDKNAHAHITAESQRGHITLDSFGHASWPWAIQSSSNFAEICQEFGLRGIPYHALIDHLRSIQAPPLNNRLRYTNDCDFVWC